MKFIRNNIFSVWLMYKTSFAINPILTTVSTAIVGAFAVSVAKIFGL